MPGTATRKLDPKRRLVLTPYFKGGDLVKLESEDADTLIVRRLKPVERKAPPRKRLVRRKDGSTYLTGGKPVTNEDVRRIMADFP